MAPCMVKGWTALAILSRTSLRRTVRYRAGCVAGAADICRSDHILAVFLVVPGVSLDSLLSYTQLLSFQLNHFQIEGQFDTTPIVTNTNSKRESKFKNQNKLKIFNIFMIYLIKIKLRIHLKFGAWNILRTLFAHITDAFRSRYSPAPLWSGQDSTY